MDRAPQPGDPAATDRAGRAGADDPLGIDDQSVVVRVAGIVPARLDLSDVGTPEQMLGISVGTVLCFLRSAITARAAADAWSRAAVLAVAGRRPRMVGPSTVGVLVQLAGDLQATQVLVPARNGPAAPPMLPMNLGRVVWEVRDSTAYTSLLRAWRQAGRLLENNLTEDYDEPENATCGRTGGIVDNSGWPPARPSRPRHAPDVGTPWTVHVLPTGAENLIALGGGREATSAGAAAAATDTLVRCAPRSRRPGGRTRRQMGPGGAALVRPAAIARRTGPGGCPLRRPSCLRGRIGRSGGFVR